MVTKSLSPPPRPPRHGGSADADDDDNDDDYKHGRDSRSSRSDRYSREKRRDRDDGRRSHQRSRSPRLPEPGRRASRSRERNHGKYRSAGGDEDRYGEARRRRSPERVRRDHGDRPRKHRRDHQGEDGTDGGQERQVVKRSGPLPSQADSFAIDKGEEPPKEKEKPNFGSTGALAAASNSIAQSDGSTIVLKYHEPPEARKPSPKDQWKLFVFKGKDIIDTIDLNNRTCWLIGREMAIIDIAAEHPSISKQHAVIQFRYLEKKNEYGDRIGKVKPYLIDLNSANGTMLNSSKVPDSRYLEIQDKDLIQFGQSTREYVLMLAPRD